MKTKSKIDSVWSALLEVNYFSPSPSTQYGFVIPKTPRADTDPYLNDQPWYTGSNAFASIDQTWKTLKKEGT